MVIGALRPGRAGWPAPTSRRLLLNPGWDAPLAQRRLRQIGLDPAQRAGRLSGGQRAQLALTLADAKRPELLILDEPAASPDPLARRGFLENLMEFVADLGATAVLSSHLLAGSAMPPSPSCSERPSGCSSGAPCPPWR